MVIGVACGNGAEPTSLSDEVPTQAPPTAGGTTPTESNPPTTPIVSHGGPVKDYVSLVDNLRAAGATVNPAGTVSADYFAPQGQLLTVNGEDTIRIEVGIIDRFLPFTEQLELVEGALVAAEQLVDVAIVIQDSLD